MRRPSPFGGVRRARLRGGVRRASLFGGVRRALPLLAAVTVLVAAGAAVLAATRDGRHAITMTVRSAPAGTRPPSGADPSAGARQSGDVRQSPATPPSTDAGPSPGSGVPRGFAARVAVGSATTGDDGPQLTEISGIDASRRYQGYFWVHNDSGDSARVFLLDGSARLRATVTLSGVDLGDLDLEDIAVGPGPADDAGYVYVADIGNNDAARDDCCAILRFAEPDLALTGTGVVSATVAVESMHFDYGGDGASAGKRDAEALMVDPRTNQLFVISKTTMASEPSNLYQLAFTPGATGSVATHVRTIEQRGIVAADISADGSMIIAKNYQRVYCWQRGPGQTVPDALAATPSRPPYSQLGELQGEAIALVLGGDQRGQPDPARQGFYTIGEARNPPLYFYRALR